MDGIAAAAGIATIVALLLNIYQFYLSRRTAVVEAAKYRSQLEVVKHLKFDLLGAAETINLIVQRTKRMGTPNKWNDTATECR
ncbi:MAG: hypothetical protein ABW201_13195 [Candidatus Thiodiazotropha sp.]